MTENADTPTDSGAEDGSGHSARHTWYIVGAIVLAIIVALVLPGLMSREDSLWLFSSIGIGGEVFLRALTMLVVPLVMASVMSGILGMGDVRKLGRPGATAILYYLATTVLAVVVGLVIVSILRPGVGVTPEVAEGTEAPIVEAGDRHKVLETVAAQSGVDRDKIAEIFPELKEDGESGGPSLGTIFKGLVLMLFTDNLIEAAANTNLLPLIVFAIIFAGMLTTMGRRVDDMTHLIGEANDALMSFVMLLMKVAPIGIFCLIAARFGTAQTEGEFLGQLSKIGWFMLTVLLGLALHGFGTLPLIYWVFTRKNPYTFMRRMAQALLTAFSTASSSATLPVTMKCASVNAGVSKRSTDFVLPLGATINMDGTALYEAAAAIFIAQMYAGSPEGIAAGFTLSFATMLVIAITATLAAIGAAGIPEAGLVTMAIVLNAVGLPLSYISSILAVDWLLDRFRTATNTFGDSVGAAVVDQTFPKDEPGPTG